MDALIISIKYQIANIHKKQQPVYSHDLYKDVHFFIRTIRLKTSMDTYNIKEILYELNNIQFLLETSMEIFPDYDSLEYLYDLIISTIITLNNIQISILNCKTRI